MHKLQLNFFIIAMIEIPVCEFKLFICKLSQESSNLTYIPIHYY